jgi:hypothetical protein
VVCVCQKWVYSVQRNCKFRRGAGCFMHAVVILRVFEEGRLRFPTSHLKFWKRLCFCGSLLPCQNNSCVEQSFLAGGSRSRHQEMYAVCKTRNFSDVFNGHATGFYPDCDEPCPHFHILFPLRSMLMLSCHLRLFLSGVFFPSDFRNTVCPKSRGGVSRPHALRS